MGLDLAVLQETSASRAEQWHGARPRPDDGTGWTGADWSNAMCGEAGEAANIVKKLRRHETGAGTGYNTPPYADLIDKLGEEIADVVCYAVLLAEYYGIELSETVIAKFNQVSRAQNFPQRVHSS